MGAPSGLIVSNSTATWTWDTATGVVTGSGLLVQQSQVAPTLPGQVFTRNVDDLSFGGAASVANATSFDCIDGSFSNAVFASFCGNYNFGGNYANESSISYGPGLAFSRTIGGDDVALGAQQSISEYDNSTTTSSGIAPGDTVTVSNINTAITAGQALTFTVVPVPAAAWLFGSALGLLGWARRRTTS
ncbi:MAG: VPLPA-CTERM sorting domain-containing protein [Gammaproteobacteria bacterium]